MVQILSLLFSYFYFIIKFVVLISEGNVSIMHVPNQSSTRVSDPTSRACHCTLVELLGNVQIPILERGKICTHDILPVYTSIMLEEIKAESPE